MSLTQRSIPRSFEETLRQAVARRDSPAASLSWDSLRTYYLMTNCWVCNRPRFLHGFIARRHLLIRKGRG